MKGHVWDLKHIRLIQIYSGCLTPNNLTFPLLLADGSFLDALTNLGGWGKRIWRQEVKTKSNQYFCGFFLMTVFDLSPKRKNLLDYFIPVKEMDNALLFLL